MIARMAASHPPIAKIQTGAIRVSDMGRRSLRQNFETLLHKYRGCCLGHQIGKNAASGFADAATRASPLAIVNTD
jgi:hypothetical protein